MSQTTPDVLIIGGGPAGACAAIDLARRGHAVTILEKDDFPRFHVGESLLPSINPLLDGLGLTEALAKVPKVVKRGAEIVGAGQDQGARLYFRVSKPWGLPETFNIERAVFDKALLDHAASRDGVTLEHGVAMTGVDHLRDGDCQLQTTDGPRRARIVLDCSGQGAVLGKQLGLKKILTNHRKVAFVGHFTCVKRLNGDAQGFISVVMADDGWYWVIPIDDTRTSIGLVVDKTAAAAMRKHGVAPSQELPWAIERTPCLAGRLVDAQFPETTHTVADFSYTCSPGAGEGYLLVGDAESFLDPVFSSGTYLAVRGALDASDAADNMLQGKPPNAQRERYLAPAAARRAVFFHYINRFYSHPFRELLLQGRGPMGVHRALIAVLSGRCEGMPLGMRGRLRLLDLAHHRQKTRGKLVPQQPGWSILEGRATERQEAIDGLAAIGHG